MNSRIKQKSIVADKGTTALLFALATLVLVISCPFKRLVQFENKVQWGEQRSSKSGTGRPSAAYSTVTCCKQEKKVLVVKPASDHQHIQSPDFISDSDRQSGFYINYFLSGISLSLTRQSVSASLSSLPLFLQHRRLLI